MGLTQLNLNYFNKMSDGQEINFISIINLLRVILSTRRGVHEYMHLSLLVVLCDRQSQKTRWVHLDALQRNYFGCIIAID